MSVFGVFMKRYLIANSKENHETLRIITNNYNMVFIHLIKEEEVNRRPTDKSKKAGKFMLKNKGFYALLTFMWYEVASEV